MQGQVLGIISGWGELPSELAREARKMGYRIVSIALEPMADDSLKPLSDVYLRINVGKLGSVIEALKENGALDAVMIGKVTKSVLYKPFSMIPDMRAAKMLMGLRDRKDDTILLAITEELGKDGIRLHRTTDFCKPLLTPEGVLTKKKPSKSEWADIEFGFRMAKAIGELDIGQTVVVKDMAVMAVEAIEGTDEAIKRGGLLAEKDAVVVKAAKPRQDLRFDVPAVGLTTLQSMIEAKVRVLAVEAGMSIFIKRDEFIERAERAGISIVGYKPEASR